MKFIEKVGRCEIWSANTPKGIYYFVYYKGRLVGSGKDNGVGSYEQLKKICYKF